MKNLKTNCNIIRNSKRIWSKEQGKWIPFSTKRTEFPITKKSWAREERRLAIKIRKGIIKETIKKHFDVFLVYVFIAMSFFMLGRFIEALVLGNI